MCTFNDIEEAAVYQLWTLLATNKLKVFASLAGFLTAYRIGDDEALLLQSCEALIVGCEYMRDQAKRPGQRNIGWRTARSIAMGGCPPRPSMAHRGAASLTTCCVQEASKRKTACSMPSRLLCRNLKDSAPRKCAETWRFPHTFGRCQSRAVLPPALLLHPGGRRSGRFSPAGRKAGANREQMGATARAKHS